MEKVLVKKLYRETSSFMNKEVEISGWVRKIRVSKGFGFIEINDGSFFKGVQIVFDESLSNFDGIIKIYSLFGIFLINSLKIGIRFVISVFLLPGIKAILFVFTNSCLKSLISSKRGWPT